MATVVDAARAALSYTLAMDTAATGRTQASTLAAFPPAEQVIEVLLNLIIKEGENQHPAPATCPAPVIGTLNNDPPEPWHADAGFPRTAARYL